MRRTSQLRNGIFLRTLNLTRDELFWIKVGDDSETADDCWPGRGPINNMGYGVFAVGDRTTTSAHRYAYESLVGPIPDGLVLDHLCKNPICVNPWHVDPVTTLVNNLRSDNCGRTHCPKGHEYTDDNVYVTPGTTWRSCRECGRAKFRAWYHRRASVTAVA